MEEDRISKLPDNLIHHILSFNDAKYAVQTSALSKRWMHIWKSLPFLTFDRNSFSDENIEWFKEFVDMVLIFRNDTTDIQRFSLDWDNSESDDNVIPNVNRWCLLGVRHHVHELSVILTQDHDFKYEIPHRLLNCKSLTKLEMRMWSRAGYANIILPRSVSLPQIKELILDGLSISDAEFSKRLLSSSPVLEVLELVNCNIETDSQRNLIIHSASLRSFGYTDWNRCIDPQNDTTAKIIKLCAPNLEDFTCKSFLTPDYSLENCSHLSDVTFDLILKENEEDDENPEMYSHLPSEAKQVYAKRLVQLLGDVYMVKSIRLTPGFLEVFLQAPDLLNYQPPRLCNLESLTLEMWSTRDCLRAITYLLKISPNITAIYFELEESSISDVGDDWEAGFSVPGILCHLKYVQVEEAEGYDAEVKLLTFLLKNAKVLEKIDIYFGSSIRSLRRVSQVEQFKDKLRAVSAASSSVELVFH